MKNNLYCFGDSFTEGHIYMGTGFVWTKIIHNSLPNFGYHNLGSGGASNIFIIKEIISKLYKIKRGDIVTILDTSPDRTEIYAVNHKRIIPTTTNIVAKAKETNEFNKLFKNRSHIDSLFNFTYDHRYSYYGEFDDFYAGMFFNFQKYFKSIGVNCIYIKSKLVTKKYEHISANDYHWSKKGNLDFASDLFTKHISPVYPNLEFNGKNNLI